MVMYNTSYLHNNPRKAMFIFFLAQKDYNDRIWKTSHDTVRGLSQKFVDNRHLTFFNEN